jgi:uncharacterized membrane protein YdjX (TVP38/TMEM64 family)
MKDIKKHLYFVCFLIVLFILSKFLSSQQIQNNDANILVLQKIQIFSEQLQNMYRFNPILSTFIFCILFFIVTILYIPFSGTIFVLFAGAMFGFVKGVIIFSFLVSISYTASFLISKYFVHNYIRSKLGKRGKTIVEGFEKDGVAYLLSLRFSGIIPAVFVNTAMAITNVTLKQFYITAQIGTFPHVLIMIYAGSKIFQIVNMNMLVPSEFFLLIVILSFLPILTKIGVDFFSQKNSK